jgi:AcrR family transcriptional regulator
MARRIPENRFDELVRSATQVFIERGYRRTQMSDIATAVGVAKGTLYGYVESKDALLLLCLGAADDPGPIALPEALPLASPPAGLIGTRVKDALALEAVQPRLELALSRRATDDVGAEARAVVGELYDLMHANRHRIKLLDRCLDHPELQDLWQTQGREGMRLSLARYIDHRIGSGHFRPIANLRLAARIVLETCATWAVHIHWDRAPEIFDAAEARETTIDFLVRGLLAAAPSDAEFA